MLSEWDRIQLGRIENIARGRRNVVPSHLGDRYLFDFEYFKDGVNLIPTLGIQRAR